MDNSEDSHSLFVTLLEAHQQRIFAFICILVFNNFEDAEEAFQRSCLVLWEKFGEYDDSKNFGAWACRIAHFEVLKIRDSRKRMRFLSEQALNTFAEAAIETTEHSSELPSALIECLRKLPEKDRLLVEARHFRDQSVKEISSQIGRSVQRVYRDLARIHGNLMRCVQRIANQS